MCTLSWSVRLMRCDFRSFLEGIEWRSGWTNSRLLHASRPASWGRQSVRFINWCLTSATNQVNLAMAVKKMLCLFVLHRLIHRHWLHLRPCFTCGAQSALLSMEDPDFWLSVYWSSLSSMQFTRSMYHMHCMQSGRLICRLCSMQILFLVSARV